MGFFWGGGILCVIVGSFGAIVVIDSGWGAGSLKKRSGSFVVIKCPISSYVYL